MSNARDKANIPALNFSSTGIDDNATSTAITIDSSGDLGINTSSPNLHGFGKTVTLNTSNSGAYELGQSGTKYGAFALQGDGRIQLTNFTSNPVTFQTNNTERMRIDSSGNVGIKNTTMASFSNLPATDLVVGAGTTDSGITIYSGTTHGSNIAFADGASGDARNQGIIQYHHNGNYMRFFTNASERVRLDNNSGTRLFIGTTSDVSHGLAENNRLIVSGYSGNGAGMIGFQDTSGNTDGTITVGDGSMTITADTENTTASSSLRFRVDNDEKMRITSDGYVGLNTSSPTLARLQVENSTSGISGFHVVNTAGQAAKIHSDTNNSGDLGMSILAGLDTASSSGDCKWVRLADGNDSGKAYIQFKSSSPNAEFAAISDERLKTNIQDTDVVGLDVINNLRLVKFDWNDTATQNAGWSMTGHQKLGFVAQEVEQILPEFISEDTNGFKIMGDSGFVPYLIKAMQEQQTKIQELEARITALETNNP